tara:strand:+ start:5256 stop:5864 length:609 start_codon:yes stop_codon:yes gene_type:complete
MSNYSKATNFTAKDSLSTGDANKIINGSLFDAEFDPISTAIASKIDKVAGETGEVPIFTSSGGLESSGKTPSTISFVSGTVMSFFQASAPTGWTQVTASDNAMLRVVSGTGGGTGGTDSPISHVHTHTTGSHALTIAEMPSHDHAGTQPGVVNLDTPQQNFNMVNSATRTGLTGGGETHNHGTTGSNTFSPKYIDMILASKD